MGSFFRTLVPNELKGSVIDITGKDLATVADPFSQGESKISISRSDIGDSHSGFDSDFIHDPDGHLPKPSVPVSVRLCLLVFVILQSEKIGAR